MCVDRDNAATWILCLCCLFALTHADWAIEDDGCRTPDRGVGSCIPIRRCSHMVQFMAEIPKPYSNAVVSYLRRFQCGQEDNSIKVCCPSGPINNQFNRQTVDSHRNLKLLPLDSCGVANSDDRIINGNKTGVFEFPWMALISYQTNRGPDFRCGGTIINRRYILTAAHCLTHLKSLQIIGVRIGEHDVRNKIDCETGPYGNEVCAPSPQDIGIENVIPHEDYDKNTHTNDIGLLRLKRNIDLTSSDSVRAICLPTSDMANYNFTNRNGIVTGWGATEKGTSSPDLLKVEIPFIPNDECRETYRAVTEITEKQLCAGGRNNRDSCSGDSGGPLHVVGSLNGDVRFVQQGVVSFGPRSCGIEGYPGVYSRVSKYMQWILDNIKS